MIDLETALFDLADHLDHPAASGLEEAVRARIASITVVGVRAWHRRARAVLAVAAAVVVLTAAVITIGPARHAIAEWLGIGAVEVRHSGLSVPAATGPNTVPGAVGAGTTVTGTAAVRQLAAARTKVQFPIATPSPERAGTLAGVAVDARVPAGLVVLRYPRFTLVEVASRGDSRPILRKTLATARVVDVTVAGVPGMWITGPHIVGYVGRDGNFRTDTVRRSGPVLLWERGEVTYRIEGIDLLADALAVADSLH